MEKKKLTEIILSVFVALIFLTSYAAYGGNSIKSNNATTTAAQLQTFFGVAHGAANITSYAPVLNINIFCSNVTPVSTRMNNLLTSLEKNGSVANYYEQNVSDILVQTGNESAYGLYALLYKNITGYANCTTFNSQANIRLPNRMLFSLPAQKTGATILIPNNLRSYSLAVKLSPLITNTVNVSVSALLTINGSIYGNMSVRSA